MNMIFHSQKLKGGPPCKWLTQSFIYTARTNK